MRQKPKLNIESLLLNIKLILTLYFCVNFRYVSE